MFKITIFTLIYHRDSNNWFRGCLTIHLASLEKVCCNIKNTYFLPVMPDLIPAEDGIVDRHPGL